MHISILSAVIILCLFSSVFAYSGGSGTATSPYKIATVADWQQLMSSTGHWSAYFVMTADVNLYGVVLTPVGNSTTQFRGIFDGNDHIISNVVINQPSSSYVGLFGRIGENGKICNLVVEDANIAGSSSSGGGVGGIAGFNYKGTISNCYYSGIVSGYNNVGGLVGDNYGTVTGCYATGKVKGSYSVGGLAGYHHSGINTLINCYATSNVNGLSNVGGLVGLNGGTSILKCYATGAVSGTSSVGGLIGGGNSAVSCFWDVNSTGQTTSAGGTGAVGKTTAEMKMLSTFLNAGWDFSGELPNGTYEIWQTFVDGTDYPHLRWEYPKTYYSGGAGTEAEPYQISNVFDWLQLMNSKEDWGKCFIMTADVNLAGLTLTPIGNRTRIAVPPYPVIENRFAGIFDGGGHIISNVIMDADSNDVGLFGITDVDSEIRNLGLTNIDITYDIHFLPSNQRVGGLVGSNFGTISNCYAVGDVSGYKYIGILVGQNNGGTIYNCYTIGTILGGQYAGGLSGLNTDGTITQSYSNAVVEGGYYIGGLVGYSGHTFSSSIILNCHSTGAVSGVEYIGGLTGYNHDAITSSYATGTVYSSAYNSDSSSGGLVGYNHNGTILRCYASGAVSGKGRIGGLVAYNDNGTIQNCYASGSASGTAFVGGLIGDSGGTVSKCYSTGAVSGTSSVGGLVGTSSSIADSFWDIETSGQTISGGGAGVVGKMTADMKTLSTFTGAGWDFTDETVNGPNDIWRMCVDGVNYPKLSWQFKAGDFGCPDGVDIYDLAVFVDQWLFEELSYDLHQDNQNIVNFLDFGVIANNWNGDNAQLAGFAAEWLQRDAGNADIAPAPDGDGIVNMLDFAALAENWMIE
ncbi:MAG: GLUG motif-containing protein [Sedimentisphaerales bacterium]